MADSKKADEKPADEKAADDGAGQADAAQAPAPTEVVGGEADPKVNPVGPEVTKTDEWAATHGEDPHGIKAGDY